MAEKRVDELVIEAAHATSKHASTNSRTPAAPTNVGAVLNRRSQARQNNADRVAAAHAAIDAARERVARVRGCHGSEDEKVALSAPLGASIEHVTEVVKGIDDDSALTLTASIKALMEDMDSLEQVLSVPKKLKWHREFAHAFDAETALRGSIGVQPRTKSPYSGHVDPVDALRMADDLSAKASTGKDSHLPDLVPEDPGSAVALIEGRILSAFDAQQTAVANFETAMQVDWPASKTFGDALAGIFLEVILAVATDGIGEVLGGALIGEAAVGVAGKLVNDGVKKGIKDLLGGAVKFGVEEGKQNEVVSTTAKGMFIERTRNAVVAAKGNAHSHLTVLTPALNQLEFDVLLAYCEGTKGLATKAREQFLRSMMVQWQNLKAYDAHPWPAEWKHHPTDPNLYTSPGQFDDETIAGVVEVGLSVAPDPRVDYVKLRGGEPAAIEHFRRMNAPINSLGLNRQYRVTFGDLPPPTLLGAIPAQYVTMGVGTNGHLQVGTLSRDELLTLKLYAAGLGQTSAERLRGAHFGLVDHISDAEAVAAANYLIRSMASVTTEHLEHG